MVNRTSILNYRELIKNLSEDKILILNWFERTGDKYTVKEAFNRLNHAYPEREYTFEYIQPRISELSSKNLLIEDGVKVSTVTKRGSTRKNRENYYRFNRFLKQDQPTLF